MAKKIIIIIITGYPGTGKTTLGKHLAQKFSLPFISKDGIKEILFDDLGWKDREWSMKLGGASYDLMFYVAEALLACDRPFILETYFSKVSEKEIDILKEKYKVLPLQIICDADAEIIKQRVRERFETGERHPGHVDHIRTNDLEKMIGEKYSKLQIDGKSIRIDTTDFARVDYLSIYKFIEDEMDRN